MAVIPHTPLDGPIAGVIALASVVVCCWFSGPGPAVLMPLVIWTVSRLSVDEPDMSWIPSGKQLATFLALSMLTGAVGLAGQYHRRLRTANNRHAARMREYLQALSRARIVFRDLDGRISAWNEGAQQLYGWTSTEASGRMLHELLQTQFPVPLQEIRRSTAVPGSMARRDSSAMQGRH
jgi:PAS domain-containing protein